MANDRAVTQSAIEAFWDAHPCGEGLIREKADDLRRFFDSFDAYRYATERHIPACLDAVGFAGKRTLEIGLGQGADSEQIIRRGARWSGIDLTATAVARVRARLELRGLPFEAIVQGSVLQLPFPDAHFDVVYSHGVLHHVPDIRTAQREIRRVLRPGGRLVVMLYARYSLNYLLSIALVRRAGLVAAYLWPGPLGGIVGQHVANARAQGLWRYLHMEQFVHRNTDGPLNPYSKVYDRRTLEADFPDFRVDRLFKRFMHAPPLPVQNWPGGSLLGWHLWAHLTPR